MMCVDLARGTSPLARLPHSLALVRSVHSGASALVHGGNPHTPNTAAWCLCPDTSSLSATALASAVTCLLLRSGS